MSEPADQEAHRYTKRAVCDIRRPAIDRFASFAFADDPAECRVDGDAFESCTSPVLFADVGEGAHTFDVPPAGSSQVGAEMSYAWEVLNLWENPTDDLQSIQPIPAGLRMIAGDATNPTFSATPPNAKCRTASVWTSSFRAAGTVVCPDSHPVPIVRPSCHYAFGVRPDVYDPSTRASTGWRLSADTCTVGVDNPGGAALHADWFNGWHPSVMEAILETCIQGRLDCHDGNLGNGFRLSDVFEGVQNDPEVISDGLGAMGDHADVMGRISASASGPGVRQRSNQLPLSIGVSSSPPPYW